MTDRAVIVDRGDFRLFSATCYCSDSLDGEVIPTLGAPRWTSGGHFQFRSPPGEGVPPAGDSVALRTDCSEPSEAPDRLFSTVPEESALWRSTLYTWF